MSLTQAECEQLVERFIKQYDSSLPGGAHLCVYNQTLTIRPKDHEIAQHSIIYKFSKTQLSQGLRPWEWSAAALSLRDWLSTDLGFETLPVDLRKDFFDDT